MSTEEESAGTPKLAVMISIYHVVIFVLSGTCVLSASETNGLLSSHLTLVYVLAFGAIGGALNASRYVVIAVRHGAYDNRRFLWQTLTPIHGSILAGIGFVVIQGGIVALTPGIDNPKTYKYFLMGVSLSEVRLKPPPLGGQIYL
ncbi:hypothetical protein [Rhabdochromatium marinum]|uniref:hypothetical protein n=1 Tax=Rhabdochromatium marinum TaxID=48729 RepID=UPI0019071153|nr:hypothetical protein [Rhabdochromatium marinum]